MNVDASIKSKIDKEATELELIEDARKRGYITMFERGLDFVYSGETSFDELLRTIPSESI